MKKCSEKEILEMQKLMAPGTIIGYLRNLIPDPFDCLLFIFYLGYIMTTDISRKNIFIIENINDADKKTLIDMIRRLVGDENISNMSIGALTDQDCRGQIAGKLLNYSYFSYKDTKLDRVIKSIVNGRLINGRIYGGKTFSFKPIAKFLLTSCERVVPEITDETSYFYDNAIIITANKNNTDSIDIGSFPQEDFYPLIQIIYESQREWLI